MHGQRLHHGIRAAEVTQQAFVDCAGSDEAKTRVEPVAHICHVLVAQYLEQQRGHQGIARLAVIGVVQLPPRPFGCYGLAYVLHELGLHIVGKVAIDLPRDAVGEDFVAVFIVVGVDSQRADDSGVVAGVVAVGMQSKADIHGHAHPLRSEVAAAAARQVVEP